MDFFEQQVIRKHDSDKKYSNRNSSSSDRPSRSFRNSNEDRGSRYSRDDRGSRNSRDNFRSSRGKSDKLLRKQESFYSGGSAKFNESLQKKLYEIADAAPPLELSHFVSQDVSDQTEVIHSGRNT